MKKFSKISIVTVLAIALVFGFTGQNVAHAALVPGTSGFLGAANGYSVWGKTGITGGAAATAWGDAGENGTTNDGTLDPVGTYHTEGQSATVGVDIAAARDALDAADAGINTVDLASTDITVEPGVYNVSTTEFSKNLTLHGSGIYIFKRLSSDIAQTSGGTMTLDGACASDVYWDVGTSMTFATGTDVNMYGTIIAGTTISFGESGLTLQGRALTDTSVTFGGFIINITEPTTCVVPEEDVPSPSHSSSGSTPTYGCKDPTATNYNYFSSSRPELCTYASVAKVVTPTPVVPKLPKTGFPPETWYESLLSSFLNLFR